jgi:TPR repeat protein
MQPAEFRTACRLKAKHVSWSLSAIVSISAATQIAGCAAPYQKPCVAPTVAGSTAAAVYDLAYLSCKASQGDKGALLALGKSYETGDQVETNLARAANYYAQAAKPETKVVYVYSPPVGAESYGRTLALPGGEIIPGLPEANYLLGKMYFDGRGLKRDTELGRQLMDAARAAGYSPGNEKNP